MKNIIKSAAQARGFYDMPILEDGGRNGGQKPEYFDLFNWSSWNSADNLLAGSLKEELFDTIDKKIYYLQGVFEDMTEGCGIIRGENWIQFANSTQKVERCKRWINEIAQYMGGTKDNWIGITGGLVRHETRYTFPICHTLEIQPAVVKFIQDFQ